MGQHKHNPTAIAKAKGEKLPERPEKIGKRQLDRMIYAQAAHLLRARTGLPADIIGGRYI